MRRCTVRSITSCTETLNNCVALAPNCSPNQSRLRVNNGLFAVDQLHPVAKVRGSVSATSRSYSTARETKDG